MALHIKRSFDIILLVKDLSTKTLTLCLQNKSTQSGHTSAYLTINKCENPDFFLIEMVIHISLKL